MIDVERKVIQIAVIHVDAVDAVEGVQADYQVEYALCNDGTMWRKDSYNNSWEQIANIPQPKEPQP